MTTLTERASTTDFKRAAGSPVAAVTTDTQLPLLDRLDRDQTPLWIGAQPMLAVTYVLSLWSLTSAPLLVGWMVFLTLTAGVHWYLYRRHHEQAGNADAAISWPLASTFMAATYGLAWSTIGCLLLATSPELGWPIGGGIALALSITAPMLASNQRALSLYLLAAATPVVSLALLSGDERIHGPAAMLFAVCAIVYVSVRQLHRGLLESDHLDANFRALALRLSRENTDLTARIEHLREDVVRNGLALAQAQQEKERARNTLHALSEGVITTDVKGVIDYMNPVAEVLTGWNVQAARGQSLNKVFDLVNRKNGEKPFISAEQCLLIERTVIGDDNSTLVRRDGAKHDIEHVGSPIRDARGRLAGAALIFRDVTEKRSMQVRLTWAASHDALTGLINRAEFEKRVEKLVSEPDNPGKTHVLCFVDLDRFKAINDSCGHIAGDEFLKALAELLRSQIRGADTLARLGGDEFAVLLYSCPLAKGKAIAEALRQLVETFSFDWQDRRLKVSASIGLVEINQQNDSLAEIMSAADFACYTAKNEGRNSVRLFRADGAAADAGRGTTLWLHRLEKALEEDAFELFYRPVTPLDGADPELHCEIMLRLRDEHGQIHEAADFIEPAQRYRLLPDIDRWMLRQVTAALRQRHPVLVNMNTISVKLSGQSLCDETFLHDLTVMLSDPDLSADRFCFTISTIDATQNPERVRYIIAALRSRGCRFTLDHFGIGPGSLQTLKQLEVDFLNIDSTLQHGVDVNSADFEILLSVNRVAKTLGIRTIAFGVNDVSLCDTLHRMGVDYVHGHTAGAPRPLYPSSPAPIATAVLSGNA